MTSFRTLFRGFCAQLFENESYASDIQARQRVAMIIAFLIAPGLFLLVSIYPDFIGVVIRVRYGRAPASIIDDRLEWVAFLLTTYAMVGTGFVAVLAWEALTFTRRDAMVLGPLPLTATATFAAKLAALGALLGGVTFPIAVLQGGMFAIETSQPPGLPLFLLRLFAIVVAMFGSALFAFAALVALRGAVVLVVGARAASALGPPIQFLFVVGLMSLVVLSPAVGLARFNTNSIVDALPSAWFVGIFEWLRRSPRAHDASFSFARYTRHALVYTPAVCVTAVVVSWLTLWSQMRLALGPSARPSVGTARIRGLLARPFLGTQPSAWALFDFMSLTLARCRPQQTSVAINAAVGAAIVITALARHVDAFTALSHPRTVLLWIPLVLGYWLVLGLRQAFLMPSELACGWVFRASGAVPRRSCVAAARGLIFAVLVVPLTAVTCGAFTLLMGWRTGASHALVVAATLLLVAELLLATLNFIPFGRAYQTGGASLRILWPAYLLGVYAFAYLPAQFELETRDAPMVFFGSIGVVAATALCLALANGRLSRASLDISDEESSQNEVGGVTVLALS